MTAPPLDAWTGTVAELDGRSFVTFAGCNYLGLAQHPRVLAAAAQAMARFGLSTSASRETSGNTRLHEALESALTAFCGHAAGLLVPDGYIANLAAMQALAVAGVRDAVIDRRAHPSLKDAAAMAGMAVRLFEHRDPAQAAACLAGCPGPAVVATDSVFAADGSIAPAAALHEILRPGDRLLLDDCHGFAVFGRQGRGMPDHLGLARDERLIVTTTLAKGLGCGGGIVMGPAPIIDAARGGSTAYICTTPTSPVLAAAALEALRLLQSDPSLHARLRSNTALLRASLAPLGVEPDSASPIVAFTAGPADAMRAMHLAAFDAGLLAPLVAYPGGPASLYFRLSVSAAHTPDQIGRLAAALLCAASRTTEAAS